MHLAQDKIRRALCEELLLSRSRHQVAHEQWKMISRISLSLVLFSTLLCGRIEIQLCTWVINENCMFSCPQLQNSYIEHRHYLAKDSAGHLSDLNAAIDANMNPARGTSSSNLPFDPISRGCTGGTTAEDGETGPVFTNTAWTTSATCIAGVAFQHNQRVLNWYQRTHACSSPRSR